MGASDNGIQAPHNAQNYNRYAYCMNNPLMYTDPSGEILNLAFFAWVFFWESTINLIHSKPDPFGSAYNVAMRGVNTISSINQFKIFSNKHTLIYGNFNPFNFMMPSLGIIHKSGKMTYGGEVGYSLLGGWYSAGSINYTNRKFSMTVGGGYGSNYWSAGGSITYDGHGVGYYYTKYGNAKGLDGKPNPQSVGGVQLFWKGGSFRLENDFLAGKINGDTKDRWRTNALEFAFGDFVIGSSVYTNEVNESLMVEEKRSRIWGFNRNDMDSWKDGKVFSSPLWIGLRTGNVVGRIGYSHHIFQDFFQNGVHKYIVPTPYFTDYSEFQYAPYFYSGFYNPFSLW